MCDAIRKMRFVAVVVFTLCGLSGVASAKIDAFYVRHDSGPCRDIPFAGHNFDWDGRSRIQIASGEGVAVRLYGFGADFAQDATGSDIYEWISGSGIESGGAAAGSGYVEVTVRAKRSHGIGKRTITVKWPTGVEKFSLLIVPKCKDLITPNSYRAAAVVETAGSSGVKAGGNSTPDLLPSYVGPVRLTRPLRAAGIIATPEGGMSQIDSFFCSGIGDNVVSTAAVPDLVWGISGVHADSVNAAFEVQLIDTTDERAPRVLDTLPLPAGFPANTPLVQRANYPGRSRSISVISNPHFPIGTAEKTYPGCFTSPGSPQSLDPNALLIRADPKNAVQEGSGEGNNDLPL